MDWLDNDQMKKALDEMRPNPNPRIVALLSYAIDEILPRLSTSFHKENSGKWIEWATAWRAGHRSPQNCVDVAHWCFDQKGWGFDGQATDPVSQALGQLAWAAKEACYSTPTSGWLVIRYIADAMIAFGVAFPADGLKALGSPTMGDENSRPSEHIIEAIAMRPPTPSSQSQSSSSAAGG